VALWSTGGEALAAAGGRLVATGSCHSRSLAQYSTPSSSLYLVRRVVAGSAPARKLSSGRLSVGAVGRWAGAQQISRTSRPLI